MLSILWRCLHGARDRHDSRDLRGGFRRLFRFNGTAANSLALASMCRSYHSVVCHETSHIETDECGAAEFFSNGTKILVTSPNSCVIG